MRYPSAGDWYCADDNELLIDVVNLGNRKYEQLIAVHELIEAILCEHHGISPEVVDEWDKTHQDISEPGLYPGCPYRAEHNIANYLEQFLGAQIGVNFTEVDEAIERMEKGE
jgi:Mn-dependent DtxR family transcriptional regulator